MTARFTSSTQASPPDSKLISNFLLSSPLEYQINISDVSKSELPILPIYLPHPQLFKCSWWHPWLLYFPHTPHPVSSRNCTSSTFKVSSVPIHFSCPPLLPTQQMWPPSLNWTIAEDSFAGLPVSFLALKGYSQHCSHSNSFKM